MRCKSCCGALAVAWLWGCGSSDDRVTFVENEQTKARIEAVQEAIEALREAELENPNAPSPQLLASLQDLARKADAAQGDPDPQIRAMCLAALGLSVFWTDREVFRKALEDPAHRPRWEAVEGLRRKKDPAVIPDVIEVLKKSEDLDIRVAAINLLSELEAKEAIPVLVAIVTDLLERNRAGQAACGALNRLTGQDISAENYLAWERWYKAYCESAAGASQGNASGVESTPAEGKGAEGAPPPENK